MFAISFCIENGCFYSSFLVFTYVSKKGCSALLYCNVKFRSSYNLSNVKLRVMFLNCLCILSMEQKNRNGIFANFNKIISEVFTVKCFNFFTYIFFLGKLSLGLRKQGRILCPCPCLCFVYKNIKAERVFLKNELKVIYNKHI